MSYVAVCQPSAKAELARLWNAASDRPAVTDSADRIDAELKDRPDAKGIPFKKDRLLYDDPLAVMYAAYPGDDIVIVLAVKRIT